MALVAVIIPVYNGAVTVAQTIDSALAQDFADCEVIVVNDGSTDSTRSVLDSYGSKIRVIDQANRGASAARNTGVARSDSEYLAFLDADDLWTANKLSRICPRLQANTEAVLAFSDFWRVPPAGTQVEAYRFAGAPSMRDLLTSRSEILPSTLVLRRTAFVQSGGFCEDFRPNYFEDPYFCTVVREQGEFEHVPELLVTYRLPHNVPLEGYVANGRLFAHLIYQRYGKQARALIDQTWDHLGRVALQDALSRMDSGDRVGASRSLMLAITLRPTLIFERQLRTRFLRTNNLRRVLRMFGVRRLKS